MPLEWVKAENGQVPPDAVPGGTDPNSNEKYFVGRTELEKMMIPGKIQPSHHCIYVSYGGKEHKLVTYEVLCNRGGVNLAWLGCKGKDIPEGAVPAGWEKDTTLFVGRHKKEGSLVLGKIYPPYGKLYIPYHGKEYDYDSFEILVTPLRWVQASMGDVPPDAVRGGRDQSEKIFIGRAMHMGHMIPGTIHPKEHGLLMSYAGQEFRYEQYEVLVNHRDAAKMDWVSAEKGEVPPDAVPCGFQEAFEPLYVGKVTHDGHTVIGKVQHSHGCCYVAFGGGEHRHEAYKVLVCPSNYYESSLGEKCSLM